MVKDQAHFSPTASANKINRINYLMESNDTGGGEVLEQTWLLKAHVSAQLDGFNVE